LLNSALVLAGIVALLVFGALVFLKGTGAPGLRGIKSKPLLTKNEEVFFRTLQRALPGHLIFPQVAFAAFITHDSNLSSKARFALRAKFNRKIADFIICERDTLQVTALIELDDRTHTAQTDRERDALTSAAGFRTYRFQSKQKPTEAEIAALFEPARVSLDSGHTR
jgi:hypothetical protein